MACEGGGRGTDGEREGGRGREEYTGLCFNVFGTQYSDMIHRLCV